MSHSAFFPGSLVRRRCRSAEGLFVSLSGSRCNVLLSPAGTRGSGAAGPHPGQGSPQHLCPGSTQLNQHSHKSTHSQGKPLLNKALRQRAGRKQHRACRMPAPGGGEGSRGRRGGRTGHPSTLPGLGDPARAGREILPAANTSHGAQRRQSP